MEAAETVVKGPHGNFEPLEKAVCKALKGFSGRDGFEGKAPHQRWSRAPGRRILMNFGHFGGKIA